MSYALHRMPSLWRINEVYNRHLFVLQVVESALSKLRLRLFDLFLPESWFQIIGSCRQDAAKSSHHPSCALWIT